MSQSDHEHRLPQVDFRAALLFSLASDLWRSCIFVTALDNPLCACCATAREDLCEVERKSWAVIGVHTLHQRQCMLQKYIYVDIKFEELQYIEVADSP